MGEIEMTDQGRTPPEDRPSLNELAGRKPGGGKVPVCPACGKRLFYVVSTWHLADGTTRRLRKCSACGHAANSKEVFDP